jgi:hypothetical protein
MCAMGWDALYEQRMGPTEPWLLDEVGPAAVARGHYEPEELTAVAGVEDPRSRPRIAANSSSDIRQITAMTFAAPESLQHRALTLLNGVGPYCDRAARRGVPGPAYDHRRPQHRVARSA